MDLNKIYEPIQNDLNKVEDKIKEENRGNLDWLIPDLAGGLHEASRIQELLIHILASSGKRTRPALTLLASRFYKPEPENVITMAAAIELYHIATLVHDDAIDCSLFSLGARLGRAAYCIKVVFNSKGRNSSSESFEDLASINTTRS